MKPFSFLKISASLLALAAMVATSPVQAADAGLSTAEIKVVAVTGTATAGNVGLTPGALIKEGDTVVTGPNSTVKLSFADSELNVEPDTTVILEKVKFKQLGNGKIEHHTTLDLKKGGLIGDVKKLAKSSDYKVKHAQGVAGIRGTTWAILPGLGVICSSGMVEVTYVINGVAQPPITLGPGQMVMMLPGQPPVVIDIPRDVAAILTRVLNRGGFGPLPPPPPGIQIVVSALAGEDGESEERPPQHSFD